MPAIPSRKPKDTASSAKDGSQPLSCRPDPAQPRSGHSPTRQSSVASLGAASASDPHKSDRSLGSHPGDHTSLLGSAPGSSAPSPTPGSPHHGATHSAAHAVLPPPAAHELQCASLVDALALDDAAAPLPAHRRERSSSATGGIAAAMARGPFMSARLSSGRPSRAKAKAGRVRQNTKVRLPVCLHHAHLSTFLGPGLTSMTISTLTSALFAGPHPTPPRWLAWPGKRRRCVPCALPDELARAANAAPATGRLCSRSGHAQPPRTRASRGGAGPQGQGQKTRVSRVARRRARPALGQPAPLRLRRRPARRRARACRPAERARRGHCCRNRRQCLRHAHALGRCATVPCPCVCC